VPDATLKDLLASATLAFTGTVTDVGSSSVAGFPADDHTAVVTVREVLKAPAVLAHLAGAAVTAVLLRRGGGSPAGSRAGAAGPGS